MKCRACREPFTKQRPLQVICFKYECAVRFADLQAEKKEKRQAKAERAQTKLRKSALKTRRQWMEEAQREFNRYVRLRDSGLGCICCGLSAGAGELRGGLFDAGHFRSRGAAPHLRFDERNCHAQLKKCNRFAFDVAAYRSGLIGRIGLAEVELLESDNAPRKFPIPELIEIRDRYRKLANELEKRIELSNVLPGHGVSP